MTRYKILRKDNQNNEEKYLVNYFEKKESAEYYISLMNDIFKKEETPIYTYSIITVEE